MDPGSHASGGAPPSASCGSGLVFTGASDARTRFLYHSLDDSSVKGEYAIGKADFSKADRAIGCSACPEWAHTKCVHMGSLSKKDTEHVNWVCSPCLTKLRLYLREGGVTKKLENLRVSLEEKLGEVNSKVDQVQEVLIKVEKNC